MGAFGLGFGQGIASSPATSIALQRYINNQQIAKNQQALGVGDVGTGMLPADTGTADPRSALERILNSPQDYPQMANGQPGIPYTGGYGEAAVGGPLTEDQYNMLNMILEALLKNQSAGGLGY